MKFITAILLLSPLLLLDGCITYEDNPECSKYKYITFEELEQLEMKVEAPKEIQKSGKIVIYNQLLLINEVGKGIHIVDNQDKTNPVKKVFLNIPGNFNLTVKDGYIYADSYKNLLTIDIKDLDNIQVVKKITNIFNYYQDFWDWECSYDTSKGIVIEVKQ